MHKSHCEKETEYTLVLNGERSFDGEMEIETGGIKLGKMEGESTQRD